MKQRITLSFLVSLFLTLFSKSAISQIAWDGQTSSLSFNAMCNQCANPNFRIAVKQGIPANILASDSTQNIAAICSNGQVALKIFGTNALCSLMISSSNPNSNWLLAGQVSNSYTTNLPLSSSLFNNIRIDPSKGGAYRVYATFLTGSGVRLFSNVVTIIQEPQIVLPTISISTADSICPKNTISVGNSLPITQTPNNSFLSYNWQWKTLDNNSSITSISTNFTTANVLALNPTSSNVEFKAILNANNGPTNFEKATCSASVNRIIPIKQTQKLLLNSYANQTVCFGQKTNDINITPALNGNWTYQWFRTPNFLLNGQNSTTYTPSNITIGQNRYYCVATPLNNTNCIIISDTSGIITVNPIYRDTLRNTICNNQLPFNWENLNFMSGGTQVKNLKTIFTNCDSIRVYILTVKDTSTSQTTLTVCDSFWWNNSKYTHTGMYSFKSLNSAGCDSIAKLNLTVNHSSIFDSTIHICSNTQYVYNDTNYLTAGLHSFNYTKLNGCDSIVKLNIIADLQASDTITTRQFFCEGFTPGKQQYYTPGVDTFYLTRTNISGCDSVEQIIRTVYPNSLVNRDTFLCRKQLGFIWNNILINSYGFYTYKTINVNGCDSIIKLFVKRTPIDTIFKNTSICQGDSLTLGNLIIKNSGIYFYTDTSGICDTVFKYTITVLPTTQSIKKVVICSDCSYTFNGITYSQAGTYNHYFINSFGCDSNAVLVLEKGLIGGVDKICLNDSNCYSIKQQDTRFTYVWSLGYPQSSSAEILQNDTVCFKIAFTNLDTVPVILTAYDSANKKAFADTVPVIVSKPPTPLVTTMVRVGCANLGSNQQSADDSSSLPIILNDSVCSKACEGSRTAYYANKKAGHSYNWVVQGGSIIGLNSLDSVVIIWGPAGIGDVYLTETNPVGCSSTLRFCVEKVTRPSAVFNIGYTEPSYGQTEITICKNQSVAFLYTALSNSADIDLWQWNFGDGNTRTDKTYTSFLNHTYTQAGTYTATLTLKNRCNCFRTYAINVIVTENTGVSIVCKSVACDNDTSRYTVIGVDSLCNDVVSGWIVQGGTVIPPPNSTDNYIDVVWNNVLEDGVGLISYFNENCLSACSVPTNISIPVIKTTNAVISGNKNICNNTYNLYRLPLWSSTQYNWSIANGSGTLIKTDNPNEIGVFINNKPLGDSILLICSYNSNLVKCTGLASITIYITPTPTIVLDPDFTACQADTLVANLLNVNNNTGSLKWVLTYPDNQIDLIGFNATLPYKFTFTKGGWYSLNVRGQNLCQLDPVRFYITPTPPAPDSLIGADTVCLNTPYFYEVANPNPNVQYQWSIKGGSFTGDSTGERVQVQFTGSGPYSLKVTASDYVNTNCLGGSKIFDITPEPVPFPEIVNFNRLACPNTRVTYTTTYTKGDSYKWSIIPQDAGSIEEGGKTHSPTIVWNNTPSQPTGLLRLELKKCNVETIYDYVIYFKPNVTLAIDTIQACSGSPATLVLQSTPALTQGSVQWSIGNGVTLNTVNQLDTFYTFTNTTHIPTSYTVQATVTGGMVGSCPATVLASASTIALVKPSVVVNSSTTSAFAGTCNGSNIDTLQTATLQLPNDTNDIQKIIWIAPNGNSTTSTPPNLQLTNNLADGFGTYTAYVVNNGGCSTKVEFNKLPFTCPGGNPGVPCVFATPPQLSVSGDAIAYCGNFTLQGSHGSNGNNAKWMYGMQPITGIANGNMFNGIASAPGNYTIQYAVEFTDDSGKVCIYTTNATVLVPMVSKPKATISCLTDSNGRAALITLQNEATTQLVNNVSYSYSINGTVVANNITGSYTTTTSAALPMGSTHWASITTTYTYNSQTYSCTPADTFKFTIPNATTVSFTANRSRVCSQLATVNFTNTTQGTYSSPVWDFGDDTKNTLDPKTARVYLFVNNPNRDKRNVTLTVTDALGCRISASIMVEVVSNTLWEVKSQFDIIPNTTTFICPNVPANLIFNHRNAGVRNRLNFFELLNTYHKPPSQNIATSSINGFGVSQLGRYWLRAWDTTTGCYAETDPVSIVPIPVTTPKIICKTTTPASTDSLFICEGLNFTLEAKNPNATQSYEWVQVDDQGTVLPTSNLPQGNEYTPSTLLPAGTYYFALITKSFLFNTVCSLQSKTFVVVVRETPASPVINPPIVVNCNNYQLQLSINNPQQGTYTWSNGQRGSTINITEGGPYKVWFSNGLGCQSQAQVHVPLSPKTYSWLLPAGCYSGCPPANGLVIEVPPIAFAQWQWQRNGQPLHTGYNSAIQPLRLTLPGTYTLLLNNGLCTDSSVGEPLEYSIIDSCIQGNDACPTLTLNSVVAITTPGVDGIFPPPPPPLPTHCDSVIISYTYSNPNQPLSGYYTISNNWNNNTTTGFLQIGQSISGLLKLPAPAQPDTLVITAVIYYWLNGRILTCRKVLKVPITCTPADTSQSGGGIDYVKQKNREEPVFIPAGLQLVPNPAHQQVSIMDKEITTGAMVYIINEIGKIVLTSPVSHKQNVINIAHLPKGLYIVQLRLKNGSTKIGKLVVD